MSVPVYSQDSNGERYPLRATAAIRLEPKASATLEQMRQEAEFFASILRAPVRFVFEGTEYEIPATEDPRVGYRNAMTAAMKRGNEMRAAASREDRYLYMLQRIAGNVDGLVTDEFPSSKGYGNDWRDVRQTALAAANYQCEDCGGDQRLNVHHKVPIRCFDETSLANARVNLAVLCNKCHRKRHGKINHDAPLLALKDADNPHDRWCFGPFGDVSIISYIDGGGCPIRIAVPSTPEEEQDNRDAAGFFR